MRQKKVAVPFVVASLRVLHCVLFCHALATVGIMFFLNGNPDAQFSPERVFTLVVTSPVLLVSFLFWFVVTARVLFCLGIFFCLLLAVVLVMLPAMMNVIFPEHLFLLGLAVVYTFSGIALTHYFFAQPMRKTKWDDKKK